MAFRAFPCRGTIETGAPAPTVFSFGAAIDEYLERDLGIVLAALLQGRPRRLGVKVRLERDQADAQGREVAVV